MKLIILQFHEETTPDFNGQAMVREKQGFILDDLINHGPRVVDVLRDPSFILSFQDHARARSHVGLRPRGTGLWA